MGRMILVRSLTVAVHFLAAIPAFGANAIEQYLKAPFASDLSAAPSGGRVVWLLNEHGARNLWVAAAPDWKGRRLTAYKDDDGQEIGEIAWSPDGNTLVYTRGGDLENAGENPNPRNLAATPEQAVFAISFQGGAPRKIGEGRGAALSKDGRVAFLRGGQIWMTTLAGEKAAEVVHARGRSFDLRWSPDGTALLFTNDRGDHSFIGVYRGGAKAVVYMDSSVDRDRGAVWSADGRRIAFVRQAYSSRVAVGPVRDAPNPWSIRVADATTGAGKEVWRAEKGPGSAFRGVEGDAILWTEGDRLVFPWEGDGWTHLYSVPAAGGRATLLTPGEFEVEHVELAANRNEVLFSSNQGDVDRRHLWRVNVSGGALAAITSGEGIEWSPADAGSGAIAYLRSSASEIGRAAIKVGGAAAKDLAPESIPADFPKDLVKPQQVAFPSADGLEIHGQLFLPQGGSQRKPAVVFFHGGSRRQMLLGYHYMYYYSNAYAMNQYLASLGYIVLSVNYRSGIGYGLNFREAIDYGTAGGSEYKDVIGAGLYVASRPDVDPKRIGVWGGSYGGYLTAMALSRASDIFAAGVDFHGVHDWSIRPNRTMNAMNIEEMRAVERVAFESSPMSSVKTWKSPVLLIHGDDDRNVAFNQTVKLVEALRAQNVEVEQLIFPDEIHDFLLTESWEKAYRASADFLHRKLKEPRK